MCQFRGSGHQHESAEAHDNPFVGNCSRLLKRERIKRRVCTTREHVRVDIFDYIEMFFNTRRKHGEANNMPTGLLLARRA